MPPFCRMTSCQMPKRRTTWPCDNPRPGRRSVSRRYQLRLPKPPLKEFLFTIFVNACGTRCISELKKKCSGTLVFGTGSVVLVIEVLREVPHNLSLKCGDNRLRTARPIKCCDRETSEVRQLFIYSSLRNRQVSRNFVIWNLLRAGAAQF